jgi:outer membrane receptor protein involved in Fe transport
VIIRRPVLFATVSLLVAPAVFAADPGDAPAANDIIVTAPTPLSAGKVTGGAQQATAADIAQAHSLDLSDYLNRRMGGVYINSVQNNPLQPDINYRGFTASPLLGTPQGLSVYLDGVRQNQPFGDVVSWDLIPRDAIADIALIPASDPLFGRNTLGGALSIRTRTGYDDPGTAFEANYGSNARWRVEGETGGHSGDIDWFLTANHFKEDGWRDFSPSKATQAFGRLGWKDGTSSLALTGSFADTNLTGNGLQDMRLLAKDYASVYTLPDDTKNRAYALTLVGHHDLSDTLTLSANAYYRHIRTTGFNGDINDDSLGESIYQPSAAEQTALRNAGFAGFPTSGETQANTPFPKWRCIANVLLNSEPNEKCTGLANRSASHQENYGGSVELRSTARLFGHDNSLVLGGNWQGDRAHFTQSTQFGYLAPDRSIVPVAGRGAFADGTQNSENAFDARVDLLGRTYGLSAFATDTMVLATRLSLAVSVRYDRTVVDNSDRLTPGGGPGSLDGNYHYDRLNPAATLTYTASPAFTLYGSLSQTSRAPTAIELGCADPEFPCRLPNALAGDPPLRQVVTRTAEIGAHGRLIGDAIGWSLSAFRADNHRDILFVSDDASGFGYFRNFGKTRRQGIELGLDGHKGIFSGSLHYTWLDATYRSAETVDGSANSSNDGPAPGFEGAIDIDKGDRIPLVPRHILRANVALAVTPRFTLSSDIQAQSGMFARGNENNRHEADGVYYLGPGKSAGFATVDFDAEWRPQPWLKLYARLSNAFDKHYYTAGQLSATGFATDGSFVARPFNAPVIGGERPLLNSTFFSPGAPRAIWLGARIMFGKRE